jgi:hypothetical protein
VTDLSQVLCVIWAYLSVCLIYQTRLVFVLPVLVVWPFHHLNYTIGSRTFEVAAARTWNDLPEDVSSSPTTPIFVIDLKLTYFANLILTVFCKPKVICFPHSGSETAPLRGHFKNSDRLIKN